MKGALKRQWERDLALFRGDTARPGQRLGAVIGLVMVFVVLCVTVWSIVAGQSARPVSLAAGPDVQRREWSEPA